MSLFDKLREVQVERLEERRQGLVLDGENTIREGRGKFVENSTLTEAGTALIDAANTAGYLEISRVIGKHALPDSINPGHAVDALTTARDDLLAGVGTTVIPKLTRGDVWSRAGVAPGAPQDEITAVLDPLISYYGDRQ